MQKKHLVIGSLAALLLSAATGIGVYRWHLISTLRGAVLDQLVDPDSALFRNEEFRSDWTAKGSFLCGEVNSKNRMGGYVGYKEFRAFSSDFAMIYSWDRSQFHTSSSQDPCAAVNVAPWWHLR
jgi:hypothetical protein